MLKTVSNELAKVIPYSCPLFIFKYTGVPVVNVEYIISDPKLDTFKPLDVYPSK